MNAEQNPAESDVLNGPCPGCGGWHQLPYHECRKPSDNVNHPPHYTQGGIECIEAIEAIGIGVDFCRGNAIKYLWRLGSKGESLEDARKAQWYVNRLVDRLAAAQRSAEQHEVKNYGV